MVTTAWCLFTTLEHLKSLPLSWRDMVLQWTQVQHLALDLVGMNSYYGYYQAQMIQRNKLPEVNTNLMGCFTTNPAVINNMYHAGIPVLYVHIKTHPHTWNIRVYKVANDFWKPPDVVTAEWWCPSSRKEIRCRNIWLASHGTDHTRMSRPFGRYFKDLPSLPTAPSQPDCVFPAAPPPVTAQTPQYNNVLPDIIYKCTPSPDIGSDPIHPDSPSLPCQTPPPASRPATRARLVQSAGVVKLSRSQMKKIESAQLACAYLSMLYALHSRC